MGGSKMLKEIQICMIQNLINYNAQSHFVLHFLYFTPNLEKEIFHIYHIILHDVLYSGLCHKFPKTKQIFSPASPVLSFLERAIYYILLNSMDVNCGQMVNSLDCGSSWTPISWLFTGMRFGQLQVKTGLCHILSSFEVAPCKETSERAVFDRKSISFCWRKEKFPCPSLF
jgi:hypothetical protein